MAVNKTPNLGLHDWLGTEYVKREEIVENFRKIDNEFGASGRVGDLSNKIGILSTADDVLFQNDRSLFLEIDKYKNLRFQQGIATITGVATSNSFFRDADPFVQITLAGYTQINAPNYAVVLDVISSNGDYGNLIIYDKTQNGFKVKMTGSASSVTFIWTLLNPSVA
ncbi:hypothetical protein B1690_05970 [Geobacillus sp. 46C-IIa]|uniref:hypothetical protein n=1 Tax=Geobacillus sp. 46C-IIa TaxID=1963025 RepID=UPI0009BF45DF|nr:hypothetical protein [Geobacillus sp. 46C-IIa]OQP06856.1 hypothetical protein B1690_05970 [Geobacillus sp. 46C-IIa]QNU27426.1 hypothetical protein IC803_14275 [Geobacillus sp. 46C-IIa]